MVKFRLYFKVVSLKKYFVIMIMFNQMHLYYMNTITCFCFSFAPPFHLIFLFKTKHLEPYLGCPTRLNIAPWIRL